MDSEGLSSTRKRIVKIVKDNFKFHLQVSLILVTIIGTSFECYDNALEDATATFLYVTDIITRVPELAWLCVERRTTRPNKDGGDGSDIELKDLEKGGDGAKQVKHNIIRCSLNFALDVMKVGGRHWVLHYNIRQKRYKNVHSVLLFVSYFSLAVASCDFGYSFTKLNNTKTEKIAMVDEVENLEVVEGVREEENRSQLVRRGGIGGRGGTLGRGGERVRHRDGHTERDIER